MHLKMLQKQFEKKKKVREREIKKEKSFSLGKVFLENRVEIQVLGDGFAGIRGRYPLNLYFGKHDWSP